MENKFDTKIKTFQCDNGAEFKPFVPIAHATRFQMRFTCPNTLVQNGHAERKHHHIVEMRLTLLAQANPLLCYWIDAFQLVVYFINRTPTLVLHSSSPLQALFKIEPNYHDLQRFGCACYPCLKPYNTNKSQYHCQKCVYLGPTSQEKGHKCLSSTSRVYVSHHVIFDPSIFPCATGFLNWKSPAKTNECVIPLLIPL